MARITAGIATSHVPAIGAAFDLGRTQEPYWKPVFDGYEWVKDFEQREDPDVVILCYNDHGLTPALKAFLEGRFPDPSRFELESATG